MDKERRRKELVEVMKKIAVLRKKRKDDEKTRNKTKESVQYHGPYTDGSGQKFYLPRKIVNNKLQSVDYRFEDDDDMDGDRLVTNLSWLGRSGELMKMVADNNNVEDDEDDEDDEDNTTYPPTTGTRKRRKVIGGGGGAIMASEDNDYMSERSLRKALPDISQIMRNWTVHGQNLGDVVDSYVKHSRTMPIKKRLKIGNFLNTASNVLDTIGSMTENTIINSVQFRRGGGGRSLRGGGGIIGHQGTHSQNYPPSVLLKDLPATEDNVSRYTARYVDRSIDRNVIVPGETFNEIMYSGQFPVHPQGVQLAHNPQKVNVDFHRGDDDDGSSLGESDEELKGVDSSGELTSSSSDEDSESSYV